MIIIHGVETGVEEPEARALIVETTQPERVTRNIKRIPGVTTILTDTNATVTIYHCGKLYTYRVVEHWSKKRISNGEVLHSFKVISIPV